MQKGFTLIELLVVVLIIGILSAVALPQYENAVLKSRAAGLFANMKTLQQAVEVYHLANTKYPKDFTEIDISWPGMQLSAEDGVEGARATLPDGTSYVIDPDGYIGGYWGKYGITLNYWFEDYWGVKKGCFLLRAPTEKLKKLGRSMGRFTQTTQYGDIYEIC